MPQSPDERRNEKRRRVITTGSNPVIVTAGVLPRAALVRDVSAQGMGLVTTYAPPVGTVLPVWLPGLPGEPSNLVLLDVVHVRLSGDRLHHVGAACHDESSAALLGEFAARLREEKE